MLCYVPGIWNGGNINLTVVYKEDLWDYQSGLVRMGILMIISTLELHFILEKCGFIHFKIYQVVVLKVEAMF